MSRIIQAIIIALYFSPASFSMDVFGFGEEEDDVPPLCILQNILAPIAHIDTQIFLDLADQHKGTKTAELCTGVCPKIEALKTQYHSIAKLLDTSADEIFGPMDLHQIIDNLQSINEININEFELLLAHLGKLKKSNLSILKDLQELLGILFPIARERAESSLIAIGNSVTQVSPQEPELYVGSYREPRRSLLDSPSFP